MGQPPRRGTAADGKAASSRRPNERVSGRHDAITRGLRLAESMPLRRFARIPDIPFTPEFADSLIKEVRGEE